MRCYHYPRLVSQWGVLLRTILVFLVPFWCFWCFSYLRPDLGCTVVIQISYLQLDISAIDKVLFRRCWHGLPKT